MLGPILFNFYINALFLFIKQVNVYNYAEENTLAYFSKSMPDLVNILEKRNRSCSNLARTNEMITNLEKSHVLLFRKNKQVPVENKLTLMVE